jgi:hypothetical protein
MQTRHNGTLTLRNGRRTIDGILIEDAAAVRNESELYTYTTLSDGTIEGKGTWWAHVSSKTIGGIIDVQQVVIYYPVEENFIVPIVIGMLVSTKNTHEIEGELT